MLAPRVVEGAAADAPDAPDLSASASLVRPLPSLADTASSAAPLPAAPPAGWDEPERAVGGPVADRAPTADGGSPVESDVTPALGRQADPGRQAETNGHVPGPELARQESSTSGDRSPRAADPAATLEPGAGGRSSPAGMPAGAEAGATRGATAWAGHDVGSPRSPEPAEARNGCTAAQLRRFIKSRAYVPLHELRRRFELDGDEDDVSPIALDGRTLFVGLPDREARLLCELAQAGDVGCELLLDPASPLVVGVFPMRPVPRA